MNTPSWSYENNHAVVVPFLILVCHFQYGLVRASLHCLDALVAAAAVEVATEVADPYYSFEMVWDRDNTNDVFFAEKNSYCDYCCYYGCRSFG